MRLSRPAESTEHSPLGNSISILGSGDNNMQMANGQ